MSFPYHDPNWTAVAEFLKKHAAPHDSILAPDPFWWLFDRISRYLKTHLEPDTRYEWFVAHKGELASIARAVLRDVPQRMRPVFANDVFVVWSVKSDIPPVDTSSSHVISYFENVDRLPDEKAPDLSAEPVLPNVAEISKLKAMDIAEFKRAMNQFWRNGGYKYETLRDQAYYNEIDRLLVAHSAPVTGLTVLDLCCGIGRLRDLLPQASAIVGVDVSSAAVEIGRERHASAKQFHFAVMDAHHLGFPNETFDLVLFIDSIEHVFDADRVFGEVARVLKRDGRFVVTVANTDSLNQIMTRKLGYEGFMTNYQHIREFNYPEVENMLAAVGLRSERADGIFLYPYWGIPGIDEVVRPITDWDPEVVKLMVELGHRVGPEYAYSFILTARKI